MNKTDELLSRLQALEPPVIDNPDELTERIMAQLDDGSMSLHNGSCESVGADSHVCPNSKQQPSHSGRHGGLPLPLGVTLLTVLNRSQPLPQAGCSSSHEPGAACAIR